MKENNTKVSYRLGSDGGRVELELSAAERDGNRAKVPIKVYSDELTPARVAELYKTDQAQLRRELARQLTGKSKGMLFRIALRSIRVEHIKARCDGCDRQWLISEGDFTGWRHDPDGSDLCAECVAGQIQQ